MNLSLELTPDQMVELAREVAAHLPAIDPARVLTPETFTVDQVAGILGVCDTTIRLRVGAGKIRKVPHLGTAIRIPRAEVERLLEAKR